MKRLKISTHWYYSLKAIALEKILAQISIKFDVGGRYLLNNTSINNSVCVDIV